MRKTLTVLSLIAVATTIAACKMPWDAEPKPAAATPLVAEATNTAPPPAALPAPATPSATPATK